MSTILLVQCNEHTTGGTRITLPALGVVGDDDHPYILMATSVLEVHWYKTQHSSWFVDQTVLSDGGVHLVTPVDPLFFILHHLWRAASNQQMYCSAEQLLQSDRYPDLARLPVHNIQCLCDVKDIGDGDLYYRLNKDRAIAWVYCKAKQAAEALRTHSTRSYAHLNEQDMLAVGMDMVSAYAEPECMQRVRAVHNIPQDNPPPLHPMENHSDAPPSPKRVKLDPKELQKRRAAEARQEARAAALAKETKGMKKLSAFFVKK